MTPTTLLRRLHRDDEGYALVIAMLLTSIMMVSLVVALNAGNSALRGSELGVRWTRTLAVAEAGIDDAILTLAQDRGASSPCPIGGGTACETESGDYQVSWAMDVSGDVTVNSIAFYPDLATKQFTREVQVLLEPVPAFTYALYSEDTLVIKNNPVVTGDVYSSTNVTIDNNTSVCGSVIAAGGDITLGSNTKILKSNVDTGCTGKDGRAWANGSILLGGGTTTVAGSATASAPTGTACSVAGSASVIGGAGSVQGNATACGSISGVAVTGTSNAGTATTPPASSGLPSFVFDPQAYASLVCYPSTGDCAQDNTSDSAVSDFQTYVDANIGALSGEYAVWQTNPSTSTTLNLDGLFLADDLTIITNAPIDFGNTSEILSAVPAEFVIISLYVPPVGTSCTTNGGDCSIYGQNAIEFDRGDLADPDDGVVGLLYTTGKLSFKNQGDPGEGALYAGSMDIKNGFDIVYNSRIARVLGFGTNLEVTLWQELTV